MKNVFFWSTLCKSSSKIKNVGGGLISCNFSLIAAYEPPSQFHNFLATSTWCTSKEHIFHVEFRSRRIFFFKWKIRKNLNFLSSSISDRCTLTRYIVKLWSQTAISKRRPIFKKKFLCVAFDPKNNNLQCPKWISNVWNLLYNLGPPYMAVVLYKGIPYARQH